MNLHIREHNEPTVLKSILELLPKNAQLEVFKPRQNTRNQCWPCYQPESLQIILNLYPESDRLELVQQTNADGQSVLHLAAISPKSLKALLELLPKMRVLSSQTDR